MILFVILLVVLITALIIMLIIWSEYNDGNAKIAFKDFKKFYALNPARWELDDYVVRCKVSGKDGLWGSICNRESFAFNFADCWKYKWWYRQIKKHNKNKSHMESTQRMLDAVKEDIKNTQTKAEQNIIESIRITIKAAKSLGCKDTDYLEDILHRFELIENECELNKKIKKGKYGRD